MPFPFAAFLICEKNVFRFFLLKFYACLVENKISKQKKQEEGGGGKNTTSPKCYKEDKKGEKNRENS